MAEKRKPPGNAWRKGQSGNPDGRPKGIPNPQARLRKMINAEAIVRKLETAALAGDVQAARTLLERALPVYRAAAAPVRLPELAETQSLTAKAGTILDCVARGKIPPDLGSQLIAALGNVARVAEIDELARRIEALEKQHEAA